METLASRGRTVSDAVSVLPTGWSGRFHDDGAGRAGEWGRVPAARGRAVVLRIEPMSKAHRLDPTGLPSLARTATPPLAAFSIQAGWAGEVTRAARPVAGDHGLADGRHGYMTAISFARPLDELARAALRRSAALRLRARGAGQIATPATRHARSRAA